MIQKVDLEDSANLFVVSVILIAGVGGLSLTFGKITITEVACALIIGILTNLLVKRGRKSEAGESELNEIKSDEKTDANDGNVA